MDEPCQQSDLRAVTSLPAYWYVDDQGQTEDFALEGDIDHHPIIDGYSCFNCGEDFWVESAHNSFSVDEAWQEALNHVKQQAVKEAA